MVLGENIPQTSYSQKEALFLEVISGKLFIKQLSPTTLYLRIPSFASTQKEAIDKLLTQQDQLIRTTRNLIIDIRNGTGGSDYSHAGLTPYYYTQPIRFVGQRYRATELNAKNYDDERHRAIAQKMRGNMGHYIDMGVTIYVDSSYTVSKYPERVAILCNKNNASADEGFLYDARQSYKVKIFGEPTAGAFDFSNVNCIDSPDGRYVLWLTTTVSNRYPSYKIDDIGIQPDYFMDDRIGEDGWVEFVQSVIEAA